MLQVLVAEQFAARTTDLAELYGALVLGAIALSYFSTSFIYPTVVRWYRLGNILTVCSVLATILIAGYISFPIFTLAALIFISFEMLNNSIKAPAIDEQLNLYPGRHRYHFRLLVEVATPSIGGLFVSLMLFAPTWVGGLSIALVILLAISLARRAGKAFNEEVMQLLVSENEQERRNAIDLYDHLEQQDDYERFLQELVEGEPLDQYQYPSDVRLACTHKPLPEILDMLEPEMDNSLRIAVLRYDELISKSSIPSCTTARWKCSKISVFTATPMSRAMAIKTFVQRACPKSP